MFYKIYIILTMALVLEIIFILQYFFLQYRKEVLGRLKVFKTKFGPYLGKEKRRFSEVRVASQLAIIIIIKIDDLYLACMVLYQSMIVATVI